MKVPARTTGSAAQRLARSRAMRDGGEAMTCVLMPATIQAGGGRVDYLRRRRPAPGAYLDRGSSQAIARSASRFATAMRIAPTIVIAMSIGKSP